MQTTQGLPHRRVLLTRVDQYQDNLISKQLAVASNSENALVSSQDVMNDVRLVDGEVPHEGRLQVQVSQGWHSVCTNTKNWTETDVKTVCRQLGFTDGSWYRWFNKFNESRQIMLETPSCTGTERDVKLCPGWTDRKIGSGVCDYHADIGIRCSGRLLQSHTFWSGIKFDNADFKEDYYGMQGRDGRRNVRLSSSVLRFVDIVFAGESSKGLVSPAISSVGIPPIMTHLRVKECRGTGINVTDATETFAIQDTIIEDNRGYGILVNSTWGQVSLENVTVKNNGADGIRYNLQPDFQTGNEFCRLSNLGETQVYPVRITHDQKPNANVREKCCQEFRVRSTEQENYQLTAHFPFMMNGMFEGEEFNRHRASDGYIEVTDGFKNQVVSRFVVRNDTKVQSVTSTQSLLKICYYPALLKRVLFTVVVVADSGRAYDMNITKSVVEGNNGRGVWIQNQRSGVVLNHTTVTHNSYVAGLHVSSPSGGDVIVNNSRISENYGDGVNISSFGPGIKHIDRSYIISNKGRGIAVFFNESSRESMSSESLLHKVLQQTQVTFSDVSLNDGVGLLIGNVCRSDSFVNISMNNFSGNEDDVIEMRSCLDKSSLTSRPSFLSDIRVTHNVFRDNHRLAIRMTPVVAVKKCLIAHNVFRLHKRGVILINNQRDLADDSFYESLEADIEVADNVFRDNQGIFVASLGLQEDSRVQSLLFTRNMLEGNSIQEPYPKLNPRSRVAAVIVVSSSNSKVVRNNLMNEGSSKYEIGVHLESHGKLINASFNYYGDISRRENTHEIYDRIFDRKNRYNLAQVEFLQYRTIPYDLRTNELLSIDRERDKFIPFRNGQILGGEVRGDMVIEMGEYTVVRDIFVRAGSRLTLSRGVVLKFDQSVGMMVQGRLESNGHVLYPIRLTGTGGITAFTPIQSRFSITHSNRDSPFSTSFSTDSTRLTSHQKDSPLVPKDVISSEKEDTTNTTNTSSQSNRFEMKTLSPNDSSTFYAHSSRESRLSTSLLNNDNLKKKNNFGSLSFENPRPSQFSNNMSIGSSLLEASLMTSHENRGKRSSQDISSTINSKVRLSHGSYGRLEVSMNGVWGAVCSYGFDIEDAAVACQQMGLVLNARDWLLEQSEYKKQDINDIEVVISNLGCTSLDTDITKCKSERKSEFLNSCPSDVGIKCYAASWSGIRLGMAADVASLENTIIDSAGLHDYATYTFRPALLVDFHRHRLTNLTVTSNSDSGIGFNWNDIFVFDRDSLRLSSSKVHNNKYHGVITRSQGLRLKDCLIANNTGSGFHYNPKFSKDHQKDLISWIVPEDKEAVINFPITSSLQNSASTHSFRRTYYGRDMPDYPLDDRRSNGKHAEKSEAPVLMQGKSLFLDPEKRSFWYIRVSKNPAVNFTDSFTLETRVEHGLGVMVINPLFADSTDQLIIANPAIPIEWDLRKNLSSFPMLNYAYKLTVNYSAGSKPKGNVVLFIAVKHLPFNRQNYDLIGKERQENIEMRTISVDTTRLSGNGRGLTSNHYNRDIGFKNEFYHRHSNETILVSDCIIEQSSKEAFFVNSPFYDPLQFSIAEINFTIIDSKIVKNDRGIVQYSRDIRNSNNLFHWVLNRTKVSQNNGPALLLRLPYVWQYNENFTHSIQIFDNDFSENRNFEFTIDGHYANINMTGNRFADNRCREGLIKISGMEKAMKISYNSMTNNYGHYVVEFDMHSHADKFGVVSANFYYNTLLNNRDIPPSFTLNDDYQPQSFAVAMRGVQFINITRNLIKNENLQFEFLAGVLTGSLDNTVNVQENWWGSPNSSRIRERIQDFDDWNSYAIADFSPFLTLESIDSVSIPAASPETLLDFTHHSGGRLYQSIQLSKRPFPYVINSDLTIMPGAQLHIQAGVEIEFYPSVGILVLGELITAGNDKNPVILRPHRMRDDRYRFKRQDNSYEIKQPDAADLTDVRLCITESCKEWLPSKNMRHGFLEVFNKTTLQWMSVCDSRFTENNAEIVCRQLGFSTLNVHLRRGRRLDVGPTLISRVRFWSEPLECTGQESQLSQCQVRLNGYGNYSHVCAHDGEEFVYIHCGHEFVGKSNQYWGGIRFASPSFEYKSPSTNGRPEYVGAKSKLEHTVVIGAGILHGRKNAAIQMINRDVNLEFVNVSHSASHGIEAIAPSGHLRFHHLRVEKNLGSGINYLLFGGASPNQFVLPYEPLKKADVPYNIFGLVNICDVNKHMRIEGRVLLYYKYDYSTVDCVKIFRSQDRNKQIGFRIIQFNLFNSTDFAAVDDSIKLFNGDIFNQTAQLLADLGVADKYRVDRPETRFYSSTRDSLSVRLHASSASEVYGFVAEVITIPASYYIGRDFDHNITYSEISNNIKGAVSYKSAGEASPSLAILYSKVENNCLKLYENFTTCQAALSFRLQNTQYLYFHNNLVKSNDGGGLLIEASSQSVPGSLKGLIVNNLFDSNHNNEALKIKGGGIESHSPYQYVEVLKNYFTHNEAAFKSNIVLSQVYANFTNNIIVANFGKHQLEINGFRENAISYQTIRGNWFYNNFASHINEKATIYASSSGQTYVDNYFVNPDNDFELATMNRSCFLTTCALNIGSTFIRSEKEDREEKEREVKKSSINARNNWWGFNETSAITSRILDFYDYPDLVPVVSQPFHVSNSTVLSGICSGGWHKIGHTCFAYIGARMKFGEAKRFCETQNSTMPFVRLNQRPLTLFLKTQQFNYAERFFKVWVQSFDYDLNACTVLTDSKVRRHDCGDELAFFCEKDPEIHVDISFWYTEPIGIAVLCVAFLCSLFSFCCICCWLCKSREKAKEKLQRRNSIRASIRSNRSVHATSMASSINEMTYKRQQLGGNMPVGGHYSSGFPRTTHQPIQLTSMGYSAGRSLHGSMDSFADAHYRRQPSYSTQIRQTDLQSSTQFVDSPVDARMSSKAYRPLEDRFQADPGLENANVDLMIRPTFDLTFENSAFKTDVTPSASRNSGRDVMLDYEDREWPPSSISMDPTVSSPVRKAPGPPMLPKRGSQQMIVPRSPSLNSSIGQFSRASPMPDTSRFNTYETTTRNYERIGQPVLSTFAPPLEPRKTDQVSLTAMDDGVASVTTNMTKHSQYLETSLDGESAQDNNYDYCDYRFRAESISSVSSQDKSKGQPLETAM